MILMKKTSFVTLTMIMVALIASVAWATDVDETPPATVVLESVATTTDTAAAELADKVIAYYLHGHRRCATCIKLEAYTKEAIETGFAELLEQGR